MAFTKVETTSEEETAQYAAEFCDQLSAGSVVLLYGNLGMGKSVFARSIVRNLCNSDSMAVPSPTFTLVQHYDASDFSISHFDLYRLSDPEEIYEIGWEDALGGGVALVEWPERLGDLKPSRSIEVHFSSSHDEGNKRIIEVIFNES